MQEEYVIRILILNNNAFFILRSITSCVVLCTEYTSQFLRTLLAFSLANTFNKGPSSQSNKAFCFTHCRFFVLRSSVGNKMNKIAQVDFWFVVKLSALNDTIRLRLLVSAVKRSMIVYVV